MGPPHKVKLALSCRPEVTLATVVAQNFMAVLILGEQNTCDILMNTVAHPSAPPAERLLKSRSLFLEPSSFSG